MKIATQDSAKSRRSRSTEAVILFCIGTRHSRSPRTPCRKFAARTVWQARPSKWSKPKFPRCATWSSAAIAPIIVVSGCAHFGLRVTRPTLVLILRQIRAAVLVDSIERMAEIPSVYALPQAFHGEERQWYRGLAYLEDRVIPVIKPDGFLTPRRICAAGPRCESRRGSSRIGRSGASMSGAENRGRKSWVLLHVGNRRFALPAEIRRGTRASRAPAQFPAHFASDRRSDRAPRPHRSRVRRCPGSLRSESSVHRFYLIAERAFGRQETSEASAIPVNGECELATGEMQPPHQTRPTYFAGNARHRGRRSSTCSICKNW